MSFAVYFRRYHGDYGAVGLCCNGSKKRPDLNYFCFPTTEGRTVASRQQFQDTRRSKNLVHYILRKTTSKFNFLVEKAYVQTATRLSLTQRNRRIRLVHVRSVLPIGRDSDEQPQAKKVCSKKLDFEDSVETCWILVLMRLQ